MIFIFLHQDLSLIKVLSLKKLGQVESKVPEDGFKPLYELALRGCQSIGEQMRSCLLEHALEGFSLRQSRRKG